MQVTKGKDGRYYKNCPECGISQSYLRKNYALESLKLNKLCKKCSNKKTENCHRGWHRKIRVSWFNKFKAQAELRNINWEITIDDIANIMEKQNSKCALCGLDISFKDNEKLSNSLASIDRINSLNGYTKDNIQLVLKDINMMKQSYSQEKFIELCCYVAENFKST